jgi:hypothetical protein
MINIEVFYHPDWEQWGVMPVDEFERSAGDKSYHQSRADALEAAKEYNLPIHVYTKSGKLLWIKRKAK